MTGHLAGATPTAVAGVTVRADHPWRSSSVSITVALPGLRRVFRYGNVTALAPQALPSVQVILGCASVAPRPHRLPEPLECSPCRAGRRLPERALTEPAAW